MECSRSLRCWLRVNTLGDFALAFLRQHLAANPLVRDIRGRGLFIGVEVTPEMGTRRVVDATRRGAVEGHPWDGRTAGPAPDHFPQSLKTALGGWSGP